MLSTSGGQSRRLELRWGFDGGHLALCEVPDGRDLLMEGLRLAWAKNRFFMRHPAGHSACCASARSCCRGCKTRFIPVEAIDLL